MDEDGAAAGTPAQDADLLLYDFFKHLSSLVLITIGGLLLVMKDFDPKDAKPKIMAATFLLVASSGILAFSGASEIVRSRYTGKRKHRTLLIIRLVAPLLLAGGLGAFIAMFLHRFTH